MQLPLLLVFLAFLLMVFAYYSTNPQAMQDMLMAVSNLLVGWRW